jgi:oligopeptide transport system substrate-binding protein
MAVKRGRLVAALLGSALLPALALLGMGSAVQASGTPSNTFVTALGETGPYMDWTHTVYNRAAGESLSQLPLVLLNKNGQPIPGAASSWSISKNHLVWTFYLRKNLMWSNGKPLVAQDYVLGMQRMANPKTGYDFGWFWSTIADIKNYAQINAAKMPVSDLGVKALNAYTVQVTTTKPVPFLDMAMVYAWPDYPPLIAKYGLDYATSTKTMIYSGPYVVSQWIPNQYIMFTKNPKYHGPEAGKGPEHIELQYITNTYPEFLDGQIDTTGLSPGQYQAIAKTGAPAGSHLITIPGWEINMLAFNVNVKPLNSPLVRRAFMLAINRKQLVNHVLSGLATMDNSVVPKGFPGYDSQIQEPYNPAKARQLLAKAGYPGGKGFPALTLTIRNEAGTLVTTQPGAEYIQSELKQNLGINISVKVLDMATWIADIEKGNFQLTIRPYNYDYPDPSDWYSLLEQPGSVMTWNDPQYNQLVATANSSFNPKVRAADYAKAAEILNQKAGTIFLWTDVSQSLVSNKWTGYTTTPQISSFWYVALHPSK